MPTLARLLLPRPRLGGCIHLGVERDTRGCALADAQRFNYYPASPLPMMGWVLEGELRMVEDAADAAPRLQPPLPRVVFAGPHRRPSASWSPGAVHALSVSFYPEALRQWLGLDIEAWIDRIVPLEAVLPTTICEPLLAIGRAPAPPGAPTPFEQLEVALEPLWQGGPAGQALPTLRGWMQAMAVRAAFSRTGAGLRRAQRRFRDWTGQSQRDLQVFARTEEALARASSGPTQAPPPLAAVAADAGFADQSHLGREVRRVTGLPPGRLGERMRTDEAFWFYRLLGEHLRDRGSAAAPGPTHPTQEESP